MVKLCLILVMLNNQELRVCISIIKISVYFNKIQWISNLNSYTWFTYIDNCFCYCAISFMITNLWIEMIFVSVITPHSTKRNWQQSSNLVLKNFLVVKKMKMKMNHRLAYWFSFFSFLNTYSLKYFCSSLWLSKEIVLKMIVIYLLF